MKFIFSTFLIFSILACNSSKKGNNSSPNKGLESNLSKIFSRGKVTADIIGIDPELLKLSLQFTMAIAKDASWFYEYANQFPKDEPIPYHERINMDKEAFKKYQAMKNNTEFISTGTEKIKIIKRKGFIKFKSSGKLDLLNEVIIYVDSNFVQIKNCKLNFTSKMSIKDNKNAFKSKWSGYKFNYVLPMDIIGKSPQELMQVDMKSYTFIVGKIETTGKTFLNIEGSEKNKNGFKPGVSIRVLF